MRLKPGTDAMIEFKTVGELQDYLKKFPREMELKLSDQTRLIALWDIPNDRVEIIKKLEQEG